MAGISVKDATKKQWDELKPDDMSHDEFASHALDCVRRDNGEIVDVEKIVEEIDHKVASRVELAAYRGVSDALEQ